MNTSLAVCTSNPGKLLELRAMLPSRVNLFSLPEIGITGDLEETGRTLEDNALQKAMTVHELCGLPCLSDDTGLEIPALHGEPGVFSARYAGPQRDMAANIRKLLNRLEEQNDRRARFRTVLAYIDANGKAHCYTGVVEGTIAMDPKGSHGFGYDPVFIPIGHTLTFAEMPTELKNGMSHRAKALRSFMEHQAF
jgi:XTP/dITP diphosphohydrolase